MDTTARRRRIHKIVSDTPKDIYPHDVSMYSVPPGNELPLSEFEDLAIERLQLLRVIDQATIKGHKPYSEDWRQCIKEDLAKAGLKKYIRLMSGSCGQSELDHSARRADHISHFILRLAYCRSEELRRWFLNREIEWFRLRFIVQTQESVMKFLKLNNFSYTPMSNEEKQKIENELIMCTTGMSDVAIQNADFFKVHFTEVCQLVKNRRVYLARGFAYIPTSELSICIQSKFRANLNEALNFYYRRIPNLDDDRLNMLLNNLHSVYTGKNYTTTETTDGIDPGKLDSYSIKHFPLCMRNIHQVLRSTHHLKHHCRLQYGLFLKAIGLLYDDAMDFWREEFTKIMDANKFEKEYTYNFKHQYGKVGRMLNYSPYSCMKIITTSVGPGEHHGCPFSHWDAAVLRQKMGEYGISSEGVQQVMELVSSGHYQIACTKYFELTHGGRAPSTVINHPNQYFEESMNLEKDKNTKK